MHSSTQKRQTYRNGGEVLIDLRCQCERLAARYGEIECRVDSEIVGTLLRYLQLRALETAAAILLSELVAPTVVTNQWFQYVPHAMTGELDILSEHLTLEDLVDHALELEAHLAQTLRSLAMTSASEVAEQYFSALHLRQAQRLRELAGTLQQLGDV